VTPQPEFPNWPKAFPYRPDTPPVAADSAMVATTDRYATEVGVEVMRAGGNAIDAAVAVSFALAVVNPEAGNIGGGGYLVLRMADGTALAQDHRSTAPADATPDMFLDEKGDVTERSVIGALSAAVPGTVRGLWEAHQRFGSRPWAELVEPAIGLARGFTVGERFLHSYTKDVTAGLQRFPAGARIFLPGGAKPALGSMFRQGDLASTLERIRDRGPDGFYRGETADRLVAAVRADGGLITHDDLASYASIWREPIRCRYRRHTLLSMPPSSSGGVTLAESAHILAGFELGDLPWHGAEHVHLMAEAWRRAYADRNAYLADPAFVPIPLETLTSPAYGVMRARDISLQRATPSTAVEPGLGRDRRKRSESAHTTHISIVDSQRNAVALTTTINSWYGSKVVADGTGIVLNNDMDDFTAKAGVPNQFGLVQGEANAIAPGKRMLSAMAPTIVLDERGELAMVLGTPGGSTIITTVFQVISNVVDHGMNVAAAVLAPRVHHQHLPDQIWSEANGLPPEVVAALRAMGHALKAREDLSGDVEAIAVAAGGTLEGLADPRRMGTASGF
jgi:gamma-glutamyltranspeptidase/glutathione hydrolase